MENLVNKPRPRKFRNREGRGNSRGIKADAYTPKSDNDVEKKRPKRI
jgi:hypothetical protein